MSSTQITNIHSSCFNDYVAPNLAKGAFVAAFVATFFAVGGLLSSYHLLPNSLSWMNAGTHANWIIGAFSIGLWGLGIAALCKKKSASLNHPVRGSVYVSDVTRSGALGNRPQDLEGVMFNKTANVQRVDGKNWQTLPSEILILCQVIIKDSNSPLKGENNLYLPFSLFLKNDDYSQIKTDGDTIEFLYESRHYVLTIEHKKNTGYSFHDTLPLIERAYKQKLGQPIVWDLAEGEKRDLTRYHCPLETGRLSQKDKDFLDCNRFVKEKIAEYGAEQDIKFTQWANEEGFTFDLKGSSGINLFIRDTHFILWDVFVPANPKEKNQLRIFQWPLDGTYTRSMIENAQLSYENGVLNMTFPKKI